MNKEALHQQHLNLVIYELETIKNSIKGLSDADLYDYCIMDIDAYKRHDLDALYENLAAGGKLSQSERVSLEAFYILTSMDLVVNE